MARAIAKLSSAGKLTNLVQLHRQYRRRVSLLHPIAGIDNFYGLSNAVYNGQYGAASVTPAGKLTVPLVDFDYTDGANPAYSPRERMAISTVWRNLAAARIWA